MDLVVVLASSVDVASSEFCGCASNGESCSTVSLTEVDVLTEALNAADKHISTWAWRKLFHGYWKNNS